jgi:hypothetical protein
MSSSSAESGASWVAAPRESLEEQARRKGLRPIVSVRDLARDDIWESDEELDEFLAHVHAARQADRA